MRDGGRLAIEVTHPDGSKSRWSPEESDAANVFSDLGFGTSIPGGDKSLTCTLTRRIDRDYPDLNLVDRIRVYGPGGKTVWSGEQAEFPRQHDADFSISVGAVGRSAALKRFRNFKQIYVDRDPSSWHEAPLWRRKEIADGGFPQGKVQASSGSGGLLWDVPNEALPTSEHSELWYEAPAGITISKFGYKGSRAQAFTSFEAPTLFYTDSGVSGGSADSSGLTLDNGVRSQTLSTARRRLFLRTLTSGAVTPAAGHQQRYDRVAVYGDHGLTTRAISGEPDGLWVSDIKDHIVAATLPGIPRDIEQDTRVVPHLVFPDGISGEEAYLQANKFSFAEWGMYDERFFDRQPDPDRLCWEARLDQGIGIGLEGPQSEDLYNGVVVYFQDFDGETRSVGPAGFGCDYESDDLRDWTSTNPWNEWGEIQFGKLEVSQLTSQFGAEMVGISWLAEASTPKRRGSLAFRGSAKHPTKGDRPAWEVRAGDWVRITDASNDVPRRIIETGYSHEQRANVCQVDNTPTLVEPLLESMGVNLVGVF